MGCPVSYVLLLFFHSVLEEETPRAGRDRSGTSQPVGAKGGARPQANVFGRVTVRAKLIFRGWGIFRRHPSPPVSGWKKERGMTEMLTETQLISNNKVPYELRAWLQVCIFKRPLRAVNVWVFCQYYTVSKRLASLLHDAKIFFPTGSRFINMENICYCFQNLSTTIFLMLQVCICTLHYITVHSSHKNLVSNGDGVVMNCS